MEYFVTGKPLIRLVSDSAPEYNVNSKEVIKNYYNIEDNAELAKILNQLLIENNDPMFEERSKASIEFRQNATENIINDLLAQINS